MKQFALLLASLAFTLLTSCAGYQLGSDKPQKMAGVTKLAVPTFKNDTLEPRIEVLVTNALIKKLQMDGSYQIVPVNEADAVVVATITEIQRSQFRSARNNTLRTSELLMGLLVTYKVEDNAGTSLMAGQAQGYSNIVLDANQQLTERQALADAAEKLSINLSSALTDGW